ncbi:xanthine dehydrogenase YagR molybdenum-binding subunit [Amorphus suaedae]
MTQSVPFVGTAQRRIDGRAKVTGSATYAGEFAAPDLLHGVAVSGAIARGRIRAIDISAAEAVAGVVRVFTHENRPQEDWFTSDFKDMVAPDGTPFRPLRDDRIQFSGQPVALVVAEDFETATYAAALVKVDYELQPHQTDVTAVTGQAYDPDDGEGDIVRGSAENELAKAPSKVDNRYRIAIEHHNPMEPHATTVAYEGPRTLTVYDKTQGARNSADLVVNVFGLAEDKVQVLSPFVGGAFGSGLRPQYQLFLAVMAALSMERSVRVTLTRDQMFTLGYRPDTLQRVALGADRDGRLTSVIHDALAGTSRYEDFTETVVDWSGLLYRCADVRLAHRLTQIDTVTPLDMRAPGGATGMYALETAMDELAYEVGLDPVELRLRNYAERDQNEDKPFSSKELKACYRQGAERFGWSKRTAAPRSMREGRELIGYGMATGCWEAMMFPTSARAALRADGMLEVGTATADIGTGTYTILTQIAADAFGVSMDQVEVRIGDSRLPKAFVEGGSATAASAGSAIVKACEALKEELVQAARRIEGSPLANVGSEQVVFSGGSLRRAADTSEAVSLEAIAEAAGREMSVEVDFSPDDSPNSGYAHSAVFVEVRVDEEVGVARVTRVVSAVAAGRIINPKTARSQILGGVVFGLGQALHEEAVIDHALGRFVTHHLADYHVPAHADVADIDVVFVEEHDELNPLGVKGVGEIGVVGTAAAVGNAIFHATGVRVRDLPITVDKILGGSAGH